MTGVILPFGRDRVGAVDERPDLFDSLADETCRQEQPARSWVLNTSFATGLACGILIGILLIAVPAILLSLMLPANG